LMVLLVRLRTADKRRASESEADTCEVNAREMLAMPLSMASLNAVLATAC